MFVGISKRWFLNDDVAAARTDGEISEIDSNAKIVSKNDCFVYKEKNHQPLFYFFSLFLKLTLLLMIS